MRLNIKPMKGVGTLVFGMSQYEVRKEITRLWGISRRIGDKVSEHYHDLGIFLFYNMQGRLQAIEFLDLEKHQIFLDGTDLSGFTFLQIKKHMVGLDPSCCKTFGDVVSLIFGVASYSLDRLENEDSIPENIVIFDKDYYVPFRARA